MWKLVGEGFHCLLACLLFFVYCCKGKRGAPFHGVSLFALCNNVCMNDVLYRKGWNRLLYNWQEG